MRKILPSFLILLGCSIILSACTKLPTTNKPDSGPAPEPTPIKSQYGQCPTGWVNCMPKVGGKYDPSSICNNKDFAQWAKENCPDFEGIAY